MESTPSESPWLEETLKPSDSHSYSGKVRLIIPYRPWKLALILRGTALQAQGLTAYIGRHDFEKSFDFSDIDDLFSFDQTYALQIEPDNHRWPTPSLHGQLIAREPESRSLRLEFHFLSGSEELNELLELLKSDKSYRDCVINVFTSPKSCRYTWTDVAVDIEIRGIDCLVTKILLFRRFIFTPKLH